MNESAEILEESEDSTNTAAEGYAVLEQDSNPSQRTIDRDEARGHASKEAEEAGIYPRQQAEANRAGMDGTDPKRDAGLEMGAQIMDAFANTARKDADKADRKAAKDFDRENPEAS